MSGSTAAHNDSTPDEDPTKTPIATRKPGLHRRRSSAATGKSGVNLTLREQEKVIDSLKKENFSLKLKVHFLEERLQENTPEHVELALKQNINLKIEVQARGVEIKRLKKQLREYEIDFSHTLRGLLSLTIIPRTTVLYDAVAFFTVLAHMPQLEVLALSLVTFKPYDVQLPTPGFSLRKYSYHNAHISMGMRNGPKIHDTISGWTLPLTASAKTIRHISLSLRRPDEIEERLYSPGYPRPARLELRRYHTQHSSGELQDYARLVVRCPQLAHIAVSIIGDADLAHSAHLFIAAQAPLRSVALALSPVSNTRTWMHLLHDLADASVARVLQHAPALRGLRVCALSVPLAEHLSVDAMLPLTRAVCAAGRIKLRLTVF